VRLSAALLCVCAAVSFGESYDWISSGTRLDNPVVLPLLLDSDRDTAEAVVAALAARADWYVEDIITGLLDQHSATAVDLAGAYLDRIVTRPGGARAWVAANPAAAGRLVEALPTLRDAYARAAALRLLPHTPPARAAAAVAAALTRAAEALAASGGHAAGAARAEVFAALAAADALADPAFAQPLLSIARVSRDPDCVTQARRIADRLLR
jgi:hypothetical protein